MSATTITATFPHGITATRTSEAAYTHASKRQGSSQVRFHTSEAAARRAAGTFGQVVRTDYRTQQAATVASGKYKCTAVWADGTEHVVYVDSPPQAVRVAAAETGKGIPQNVRIARA